MAKKPYLVTVEIELAIFAENENDATSSAEFREAVRDSLYNEIRAYANPLNRIPDGWDESCLVYGADGDVTIKEALNWNKNADK